MTKQVVTLLDTEKVHDGVLKIGTTVVGLTNTQPAKLLKFPDLNDLSNYSVLTFPADGKHDGNAQPSITYDATGGFLYVGFCYIDGGTFDPHTVIDKVDITATPPTRTQLVDFALGTNNINQAAPSLVNDGTSLWALTKASNENSWLARINIAVPATRTTAQITGTGHVRGHAFCFDSVTSKLYFGGSRLITKLAWVGSCALDLTGLSTADISTTKLLSDDMTIIGTSFFLNHETEDVPSSSIIKVAKADLSFVTFTAGLGAAMDGAFYDGVGLWVAADTSPPTLVRFNPTTGAVLQTLAMATSDIGSHINEIVAGPDANHVVMTNYSGPPNKIWRFPLDGTGGDPVASNTAVDWFQRLKRIKRR